MATARNAKADEARADEVKADEATPEEETSTVVSQPESPQLPVTVHDEAAGVDRIVSTPTAKWTPAPVDPDPAEVARLEEFHKEQERRQEEARTPVAERDDS